MTTSTPTDSRRQMSTGDASLATRWGEAGRRFDRIGQEFPALMHVLRDAMEGQPRAQALDGSGHSSDVSDPTGAAAMRSDGAASRKHRITRAMEAITRAIDELDQLFDIDRPQLSPTTPADVEPERGPNDCFCCWVAGTITEVARNPDGTKRNGDRCARHCAFRAGHGFDPSPALSRKLLDGEKVTQGMVAEDRARQTKGRKKQRRRKGGLTLA